MAFPVVHKVYYRGGSQTNDGCRREQNTISVCLITYSELNRIKPDKHDKTNLHTLKEKEKLKGKKKYIIA